MGARKYYLTLFNTKPHFGTIYAPQIRLKYAAFAPTYGILTN